MLKGAKFCLCEIINARGKARGQCYTRPHGREGLPGGSEGAVQVQGQGKGRWIQTLKAMSLIQDVLAEI